MEFLIQYFVQLPNNTKRSVAQFSEGGKQNVLLKPKFNSFPPKKIVLCFLVVCFILLNPSGSVCMDLLSCLVLSQPRVHVLDFAQQVYLLPSVLISFTYQNQLFLILSDVETNVLTPKAAYGPCGH